MTSVARRSPIEMRAGHDRCIHFIVARAPAELPPSRRRPAASGVGMPQRRKKKRRMRPSALFFVPPAVKHRARMAETQWRAIPLSLECLLAWNRTTRPNKFCTVRAREANDWKDALTMFTNNKTDRIFKLNFVSNFINNKNQQYIFIYM